MTAAIQAIRQLLGTACLLLLAACADTGPVGVAPPSGPAPQAVDLGGSSRVRHVAGLAGEGEGYGTSPPSPPARASASTPDHAVMDHSKMDHSSMPGMSQAPAAQPQVAQAARVQGTGTVNSVDPAGRRINLNHNPIPAIGWPAMTMDFTVAPLVDLRALKPGTRVNFMMERGGDGMYVIQSITPAGGGQ